MLRRFLYLLVLFGLSFIGPALAQPDCLTSLGINRVKSVTFLAFGSGAGNQVVRTMSCTAAEQLRTDLFRSGQAVDLSLIGNSNQLRTRVTQLRTQLTSQKAALKNARTRAAREAALQSLKLTLAGAGLASATAGCVISGVSCIAALGGVVALYELADNTVNTMNDLQQSADQARVEIDKILPMLQSIEQQLNDNISQQSRLKYNVLFSEMCSAIRQQCLP